MRWQCVVLALCVGCSAPPGPHQAPTEGDGWVIRGTNATRILLTNGSLGVWVKTDQGISGEPAFRMLNGEALVPIPKLTFNADLPLESGETLEWQLDLRTGEFLARRRNGRFDFDVRIVLHPTLPIVAVKWESVDPGAPYGRVLGVDCGLPRASAGNMAKTYQAVCAILGEAPNPRLRLEGEVTSGVLGVLLNDEAPPIPTYEDVLEASTEAHRKFWETDIEIDGPTDDQLAVRTMLYYLRRGATPKLPPFGASDAKYRGARFWDAEAWMLPVLALVDRDAAMSATAWRLRNSSDRIPWEAAAGGKDVTPKEFGKALHVAGWVAWWFHQAGELGWVHPRAEAGMLATVMRQYLEAVSKTSRGYEIRGVESPDEGKLRDNDLVTNVLARLVGEWSLDLNLLPPDDLRPLIKVVLPKAVDGLPATYDGDAMKGYQQAAALLAVFPLSYFKGETAKRMYDRYSGLASEVGPAMSESVHATIAARLHLPEAYERWQKSWRTYTDDAMMFHETRAKQNAYFMTGAAGCLETVLYGFCGIGIEPIPDDPDGVTSVALPHARMTFRPNLPKEWKSVRLKNIWLGNTIATVRIDAAGVKIESSRPGPKRLSVGAV